MAHLTFLRDDAPAVLAALEPRESVALSATLAFRSDAAAG